MAETSLRQHRVIAIGGSAGSLEVALKIIAALPPQTLSVVILVLHRKAATDSILEDLIVSKTTLKVKEVEDKEPIQSGTVYIAPPDYHLLVEDRQTFALDSSEKVQYSRPSIDVCFESIAAFFGGAVLGVLLSGANADGTAGLACIKAAGGYTMAQNPLNADVGYMPRQAINAGVVNEVVDEKDLPSAILRHLYTGS